MRKLHYTFVNNNASGEVPVVLLHGFLESSSMWEQVKFPENYPLVQIDLPGHGKSNLPELLCNSMEGMANAVMAVIDELQLSNFHIIGHSMGGYVALEVLKNDARAEKIMLLNSNFWADSPHKVKDRLRVAEIVQTNKSHFIYEVIPNLFQNPEIYDEEVKSLISEALKMSPDAIGKSSIGMSKRLDFTDLVLEESKKVTVLQGKEDRIVPLEYMRKLLEGSDVNYVELDEVGHMAHFEAQDELTARIKEFLAG